LFLGFRVAFTPGIPAATFTLGIIDTLRTTGLRLPCGAALGIFFALALAIGFVVDVGFGSVPMAAAVAAALCVLLGFFRGLGTVVICGMTSGRSAGVAGPRLRATDLARGRRTGVGSREAGLMEADLAFRLGTGTSSDSDIARPLALAFALAFGTGITSAMISAAAAAAPMVGTGVAAALRALGARGGGAY
jgi:hypothetical protein